VFEIVGIATVFGEAARPSRVFDRLLSRRLAVAVPADAAGATAVVVVVVGQRELCARQGSFVDRSGVGVIKRFFSPSLSLRQIS